MKIVDVPLTYNCTSFPCLACGAMIKGKQEKVYADLDGPAFEAYYHGSCIPSARCPRCGETIRGGFYCTKCGHVPPKETI